MLTPPNCCIQVALSINRATCCFDTHIADIRHAESGVLSCTFGGQQAQSGSLSGNGSHNGPRGLVNWRKIATDKEYCNNCPCDMNDPVASCFRFAEIEHDGIVPRGLKQGLRSHWSTGTLRSRQISSHEFRLCKPAALTVLLVRPTPCISSRRAADSLGSRRPLDSLGCRVSGCAERFPPMGSGHDSRVPESRFPDSYNGCGRADGVPR
jgi:hypothetical protein